MFLAPPTQSPPTIAPPASYVKAAQVPLGCLLWLSSGAYTCPGTAPIISGYPDTVTFAVWVKMPLADDVVRSVACFTD